MLMGSRSQPPRAACRQRGAVLIVALVLLVIVTLLGVSSMSNTQMELRIAANSATDSELRQGAESVVVLAIESDFPDRPLNQWQIETRGTGADDNLPPGSVCAAGQWRIRRLGQSSSTTVQLDGISLETANFEIEAECYEFGDVNSDDVLDVNDGPKIRIATGVTLRNTQSIVDGKL